MNPEEINEIIGTEGNDTLMGTEGNDDLIGGTGDDLKIGGAGDDFFIWNNGDGSDINEGDDGYDVAQINGAPEDGDEFELVANGDRALFERLNLGPFTIDADNVEEFEINGLGGDDTLTVQDLSGTDVQQTLFTGGEGSDILNASQTFVDVVAFGGLGDDTLTGGSGNDTLIGGGLSDEKTGGAGDDLFIWNGGDGSDINEGDDGFDTAEVNLSDVNGDVLELRADGDRASFRRINLGPFTIDTDNVEEFEINGLGGNDTLTVQDLSGTDVSEVFFDGGDGDDIITFSGLRADYEISLGEDAGSAEVSDSTITSSLSNVEILRFDDGDFNIVNGELPPSEDASPELDDDEVPVYRFLRTDTQTQFYTTSDVERDVVIDTLPQYEYEELSFIGLAPPEEGEDITGASPVYRFFNQDTGVHLYTADENERAFIEENLDNYVLEGIPYYGYDTQEEGTVPLYRFYNQSLGAHFYTPSAEERDTWIESPDYQVEGGNEGIVFYVEPGV